MASGTSELQELKIRLSADAKKRPVVSILLPDGRATEFRETAVVVPESSEDERAGQVYAVLVNGNGEVLFEAATGEPVILKAVPLLLRMTPDPDQRMSYADVAVKAGVSKSTVQRAVYSGDLPKPDRLSARRVVFRQADVERWLDALGRGKT